MKKFSFVLKLVIQISQIIKNLQHFKVDKGAEEHVLGRNEAEVPQPMAEPEVRS